MTTALSFDHLIEELRRRSSRAHASLLAPSSLPLRAWLEATLGAPAGSHDGLLGTPIFEHKFGYQRVPETMAGLEASGQLSKALISNMHSPPKEFREQAFLRTRRPYTHQVAAWKALQAKEPRSVVVSAGTGSGKTECFLVPILDDLARQAQQRHAPLQGVQALFLYPLNALINSQRERLSAWTRGFDGRVRYCLYNGETKSTVPLDEQNSSRERVLSRKALRADPPPVLITNATMLEYMLVRPADRPILEASQGRLRYVVIDEAHTYVGSAAAELALLIRRVMNAFGVDPSTVRFIATSATLSSSASAKVDIQQFLADVSGQPTSQVDVVVDEREIPDLPDVAPNSVWLDPEALGTLSTTERYEALIRSRGPRLLRQRLTTQGAQTMVELQEALAAEGIQQPAEAIVQVLDLAKDARPASPPSDDTVDPFLPLRGHVFLRGLPGLWACLNPACVGRRETPLDVEAWRFGRVFTSRRTTCPDCACQVLELALCRGCGSDYLVARIVPDADGFEQLRPISFDEVTTPGDEMADPEPGDDEEGGEEANELDAGHVTRVEIRLLCGPQDEERASERLAPSLHIDPKSGAIDSGSVPYGVVQPEHGETFECPHCGQRDRSIEELFLRSCRTGRDFVLGVGVPVLLEHMREEGGPDDLPFGGRRTISFTDSRQGTARFAARAQGEAERNYVRSFVYHQILAEQATAPAKVTAIRARLDELLAAQALLPDPSLLAGTILEKTHQLAEAQRGQRVPLTKISSALAQAWTFKHLLRYWSDYLPFQEAKIGDLQLAKWMVLREFARRPMRRASLETLGLVSVQFPNLDLVHPPPMAWRNWAGEHATETWHALLKLLLDFYVRSNSAVRLDPEFFRWVGTTILPKVVGGPGVKPVRNRRIGWPEMGSRSRLAWLIVRAFDLDHTDAETRAAIDDVLAEAWKYVAPALQTSEGGRQLVMDHMELELVREAWVCPLTRMLLDTTLLGHTPYQPPLDQPFDSRARPVRMPVPHEAFGPNLREWFESDPTVDEARAAGAISEFTERVLTVSPYYQVAEHSAQLPGATLQRTEERFKKGYLNLLSCSTTMEMGVDIGGLSGVAMNNAPPSPANFLQRVGRAGRRGEDAAVSLTVCRHLPHDQAVFEHPEWPFRTPIHVTAVRLDSVRIVERHVRASVLSRFLLTEVQPEAILDLECSWFFVVPDGQASSVCEGLAEWLLSKARADQELATHLERITRATALDGTPNDTLLADAQAAFLEASATFNEIRTALLAQREALPLEEREESPAAYAIRRQLARLDGEYLLSYLADQQVLPGYGFPTGVLPLVTTTVEELKALKAADDRAKAKSDGKETRDQRKERIDARTRLMGFPSRDLPMALREYAPGGNVVLERRTYTPRGVTLNWHLPPGGDENNVRDVQALRTAWNCSRCGLSGSTLAEVPSTCPSCAQASLSIRPYLQPGGFAVDLYADAQMDAAPPVYMPVEDPWVSSGTDAFEVLGRPVLVRARHTANGEIIHLSGGVHGHGYALCLRCGRAEPEVEPRPAMGQADLPTVLKDHRRLRGGKGSQWNDPKASSRCEGNDTGWAIRRHLAFGGNQHTDVLELQFIDPANGHIVADQVVLTTLAVALRKEAARAIGVDERELGYQVAPRVVNGQTGHAVLLYDTASGGAGFCAEIPRMLPELLRRAVETCKCPRSCSGACHSCLLSNDTQHDMRWIDRFSLAPETGEALILNEAYLAALQLRADQQVFGPETALVWGDPHAALLRRARRMATPKEPLQVRLYASGDASDVEPVRWAGRALARGLQGLGAAILLVVPEACVPTEWQQARQLAGLLENEGMTLHVVPNGSLPSGMARWAEIVAGTQAYAFAAQDDDLTLGGDWAMKREGATHVEGPTSALSLGGAVREASMLVREPTSAMVAVDLRPTAAGPAHLYGERFWSALLKAMPDLLDGGVADEITYQDRYLQAPGAVQGLLSVLTRLKALGHVGPATRINVIALQSESERPARSLRHNWTSFEVQYKVITTVLGSLGCPVDVQVLPGHDRRHTPHFRSLEISGIGRELEIRLDQGFGFLEAQPPDRFPFELGVDAQVSKVLGGSWKWEAPGLKIDIPAYILREA